MDDLAIIVLAAGKGTRMKSKLVKVLHPLGGRPILSHIMETIKTLAKKKILVVGYQAEEVKERLSQEGFDFVHQERQLGTGDAVLTCQGILKDFKGTIMVLSGDVPLLRRETLTHLYREHTISRGAATLLTVHLDDATGYGRIIRDKEGSFIGIREEGDATEKELLIQEVNTGIYCFQRDFLYKALGEIDTANKQGEYYLTDVFSLLLEEGYPCHTVQVQDKREVMGINNRLQLAFAQREYLWRLLEGHLLTGVTILDPWNTYLEEGVTIGQDTVIHPFTILTGETVIGEDCTIGPRTTIDNSQLGHAVKITDSFIESSIIKDRATIGPYAHLRPGAQIGEESRVGNFVEIKNSSLEKGSKVSHLTYIGDTLLGPHCNVGAGTIIANYDGQKKHSTTIGAFSFLGSNCTLIAPVTIGEGARVGAGAVVTKDVRPNTLVIGVPAREHKQSK